MKDPYLESEDWRSGVYREVWMATLYLVKKAWACLYWAGACLLLPIALLVFMIHMFLDDDVSVPQELDENPLNW